MKPRSIMAHLLAENLALWQLMLDPACGAGLGGAALEKVRRLRGSLQERVRREGAERVLRGEGLESLAEDKDAISFAKDFDEVFGSFDEPDLAASPQPLLSFMQQPCVDGRVRLSLLLQGPADEAQAAKLLVQYLDTEGWPVAGPYHRLQPVDSSEGSAYLALPASRGDCRVELNLAVPPGTAKCHFRIMPWKISTGLEVSLQDPDPVVTAYIEGGIPGVISLLSKKHSRETRNTSDRLLECGKILYEYGCREAEIKFAIIARNIDISFETLYGYFWACERARKFRAAAEALTDMERLPAKSLTAANFRALGKINRSPVRQLSVLNLLEPKKTQQIDSMPERLCYVLHSSLPYVSEGYATRAQGLALGLKGAGFDVVALTRPGFPVDAKLELAADEVPARIEVEGIPYLRLLESSRQRCSGAGYMEVAADAVTSALESLRPAFVLAASNFRTALPALIAARRLGIPFAYEVRGFWEITRSSREPEFIHTPSYRIMEFMEAETAKHADHVFTLTRPMKEELVRRGVPANHITLLPNSCELERFITRPRNEALAAVLGIPDGVPVIGYIGTFSQYEGLDLLVEAAAELRHRGFSFRLLLVGNESASAGNAGSITTEIRRIAEERGLRDWLLMPGRVPHEQVELYYSVIDIAPFPRKGQTVTEMVSPMKPLEACAMEKAIVASSVRALQEMIEDGKTGLIFEKDNVASLVEALARLVADSELRARLGKEGRRWVESERTWDATARIAAERIRAIVLGATGSLPSAASFRATRGVLD